MDLDAVRRVFEGLLDSGRRDELLQTILQLFGDLRDKNTQLELRMAQLLKQVYGRSSEKLDPNQLALALAELKAAQAAESPPAPSGGPPTDETPPPPKEDPKPPRRKYKPVGRNPLPAELPHVETRRAPAPADCVCADCGAQKVKIGEERSEILELVPAMFRVLVDIREKWACRACQGNVVIAPPADKVVDGGLPGPGLVAHVLVSKYKDHAPIERQADIYARWGVKLAPSTMNDWVRVGADLIEPIVKRIHQRVLGAYLLQADDTGLRVLDKSQAGGVRKGHLWTLIGDGKLAFYGYAKTWSAEHALPLFSGRRGYIQMDGYAGLDRLFIGPDPPCIEVGCMAHCRRKYNDAKDGGDIRALLPMGIFAALYVIEAEAKEGGLDAEARRAVRQEKSKPLLNQLGKWVAEVHPKTTPQSPLGKAITYTINQWKQLTRYLDDGHLPIDNSASERALRPIAVGRKNWLFAGSEEGAKRAAAIYTIIGSCALNGVDPWAYLRDVLAKLSGMWPQNRLDELLPDVWKPEQPRDHSGEVAQS